MVAELADQMVGQKGSMKVVRMVGSSGRKLVETKVARLALKTAVKWAHWRVGRKETWRVDQKGP